MEIVAQGNVFDAISLIQVRFNVFKKPRLKPATDDIELDTNIELFIEVFQAKSFKCVKKCQLTFPGSAEFTMLPVIITPRLILNMIPSTN